MWFASRAKEGPQAVTKHGRAAVVVIAAEEYERLKASKGRKGNLAEFFASSPLVGSGIDLERPLDYGREVDL
jgi:Antitoxin Phd_YefM, type II toxin-antitoxin system